MRNSRVKQKCFLKRNRVAVSIIWFNSLQLHFFNFQNNSKRDGSRIQFIWNKSDQWQKIELTLDKKYLSSYWMDAGAGIIIKNNGSIITYQVAPFSSVILYASTKTNIADRVASTAPALVDQSKEILTIKQWKLEADSVVMIKSPLFDWKINDQLKFSSAEGIYTSHFLWDKQNSTTHYFLDLGKLCFTAEVYINEKLVGKRIFTPYLFNITSFLIPGANTIEVRVTPGQLNGFIGNAKNGDKRYAQFEGKEDQLMSGGLIGPVVIRPGQ